LLKILEKIYNYLKRIENVILHIISLSLIVLILIAVFNRYFLKTSMAWYEEISIYLFMLLVYWGSCVVAREDDHLSIDLFINKFTGKVRNYIIIFIWSFSLLISLFGAYFGIKMGLITSMKTVSLKIPKSIIVFSTIVAGFTVMSFTYLYKIIKKLKNFNKEL